MWRVNRIDGPMGALGDDDEYGDLSTQTTNKEVNSQLMFTKQSVHFRNYNQLHLRGHNIIIARWRAAFY